MDGSGEQLPIIIEQRSLTPEEIAHLKVLWLDLSCGFPRIPGIMDCDTPIVVEDH